MNASSQDQPRTLAEKDRRAREISADPHRFFKAFSRTARRFQHMNPSPRFRVMTLVGEPKDFLPKKPLKLHFNNRTLRVESWTDVFALLVRELVAAKPREIRTFAAAGLVPWIVNLNPSLDLVDAFKSGEATLRFTTLDEAFYSVLWLLVMCDVHLNEVVVQIDPYDSHAAWHAREVEMRAKRAEETRVLREIDDARRRYAEAHPEDQNAQRFAQPRRPGASDPSPQPKQTEEELTWEL